MNSLPSGKVTPSAQASSFSLSLDVTVAANAHASTVIPLVGPATEITEGAATVWKAGSFVPGTAGIDFCKIGARVSGSGAWIRHLLILFDLADQCA